MDPCPSLPPSPRLAWRPFHGPLVQVADERARGPFYVLLQRWKKSPQAVKRNFIPFRLKSQLVHASGLCMAKLTSLLYLTCSQGGLTKVLWQRHVQGTMSPRSHSTWWEMDAFCLAGSHGPLPPLLPLHCSTSFLFRFGQSASGHYEDGVTTLPPSLPPQSLPPVSTAPPLVTQPPSPVCPRAPSLSPSAWE